MKTDTLQIGPVEIKVTFKEIKNLHLSVHPPFGEVTISSPTFYDLEKVKIYAATKLGWIKREQEKIISQEREGTKLMITQESHQFLGKRYLLSVTEKGVRSHVKLHHNRIELIVPVGTTTEKKCKLLYQWYRIKLRTLLYKMISDFEIQMNIKVNSVGIRRMKTKWGSCNSKKGSILFNIELAKKSEGCIEYIVVHELVHLLERNHNKRFVLLMDKFLNGWREKRKELNKGEII
jgi:predicted metal-dependent hydrolase